MKEKAKGFPIIEQLKEEDLSLLLPYMTQYEFSAGTVILRQGEVSEIFHILLTGSVLVYLEKGAKVRLATLQRGHFFGEMSCLTGDFVSATVEAVETLSTVAISREGILLMMDSCPEFRTQMIDAMVRRIQNTNDRVMEEHVQGPIIIKNLEQECKLRYGELIGRSPQMQKLHNEIEYLSNHKDALFIVGEYGVGKVHAAAAIHQASSKQGKPFVTIESSFFVLNLWDQKVMEAAGGTIVLRHAERLPADMINHVLESSGNTRVILTSKTMPEIRVRVLHIPPLRERSDDISELILHFLKMAGAENPLEAISQEAMRMLILYPFLTGNVEELMGVLREAFILSGGKKIYNNHLHFGRHRLPGSRPTVGLALGCGTIRGTAHVGVLKALEQEDIPIDMIAGTSVGALIGALYASGQPISEFERVLPSLRWTQLIQLNFSPLALVNNNKMLRLIDKYIGKMRMEDLNIPFAAVTADFTSGKAHILRTGSLSDALRATTSVPGIMPPMRCQGRKLVSGAVVHPVPAAVVRSMGADIVIGVDVSVPVCKKLPMKSFVESILNMMDMMSVNKVQDELQLADIIIKPQIKLHSHSFKDSASYIATGERIARESLDDIRRQMKARA